MGLCMTYVPIARRVLAFPFIVLAAVFALMSAAMDGLAASIEARSPDNDVDARPGQ